MRGKKNWSVTDPSTETLWPYPPLALLELRWPPIPRRIFVSESHIRLLERRRVPAQVKSQCANKHMWCVGGYEYIHAERGIWHTAMKITEELFGIHITVALRVWQGIV